MLENIFGGLVLGFLIGGAYGPAAAFAGAFLGAATGALRGRNREDSRKSDEARFKSLENRLDALVRTMIANSGASPTESQSTTAAAQKTAPMVAPLAEVPAKPPLPLAKPTAPQIRPELPPAESRAALVERERQKAPPEPPGELRKFLGGINVFARVGITLILIAVAFLVKLAADSGFFPIEARLAAIALGAMALLGCGWKLRRKNASYALILQGGGVAVFYLDIFAAFRLFDLLPGQAAFFILLATVVFSAFLAVAQDSQALALMGTAGGFLAPILTSTGGGSHVALFSYYALINCGILAIAFFKAWRPLNLTGFAFTFGIGSAWGAEYFRPELFATTEPFLILFFLMYTGIAVLFAMKRKSDLQGFVDGTLVFGSPLFAFGLQAAMVSDWEYALGGSSLALGFFYLGLAKFFFARRPETLSRMAESFLALGVGFATLAIPLTLDPRWTSAAWALEGAGLVWVSIRQKRLLGRLFGTLLIAASGVLCVMQDRVTGEIPVLNATYLGFALTALAHLFAAAQFQKHQDKIKAPEVLIGWFLLITGVFWWYFAGLAEIDARVPAAFEITGSAAFFALNVFIFEIAAERFAWPQLTLPNHLLLIPAFLLALQTRSFGDAPFDHGGFLAWPLTLIAHGYFLKRRDTEKSVPVLKLLHAGGMWLITLLLTWQLALATSSFLSTSGNFGTGWLDAADFLVPAAALFFVAFFCRRDSTWPFTKHAGAYLTLGAGPIAALIVIAIICKSPTLDGNPAPLPYLPFANPLELAQAFALLGLLVLNRERLRRHMDAKSAAGQPSLKLMATGASVFMFLNAMIARTVHVYADVSYSFDSLYSSMLLQTSYSIFWSLLALAGMVYAHGREKRGLWQTGAALLVVVIVKLFLVDLSNTGSVARVVSFLGVGVLVLIVGYFAPLPPKREKGPS